MSEPGPKRICGAETRVCLHCSHHQQLHAFSEETKTRRGQCEQCETCPGFEGKPCQNDSISAGGRCKLHGGSSLQGVAHPNYKDGRQVRSGGGFLYSKSLPTKVRKRYEAILLDDDVLSLRNEIAVARSWIEERLRQLMRGHIIGRSALKLVFEAGKAHAALKASASKTEVRQRTEKLDEAMGALIEGCQPMKRQSEYLGEFRANALVLERLVRAENLHADELYNRISKERAWALRQAETSVFLEALDKFVPDAETNRTIRRFVATQLAALAPRRDDQALDAGGGSAEDPALPAAAEDSGGAG